MIARVSININGTVFDHFENLSIAQPFDDHHKMDIRVGMDDVNEVFGIDGATGSVNLGRLTQDWAGKKITITISQGETDLAGVLSSQAQQVFEGLITRIQMQMRDAVDSLVVITAMSPTAIMDQGENTYAFSEMTLSDIVTRVVRTPGWQPAISPTNNPTIPYVTMYRESVFNFLQRLAKKYGEWFFYDGSRIIFGKSQVSAGAAIALEYGSNLTDMSFETKLVDLTTQAVYYDYFNHNRYRYSSTGTEVSAQNFAQKAQQASLDAYTFRNIDLSYQNLLQQSELDGAVAGNLRMASNRLAVLKGTCTSLGLSPGSKVTINDDIQLNGRTLRTDSYGEFLITKAYHYLDANGQYQNTFEAIPNNPDFPPTDYPLVSQPFAESQVARVIETNDPDALGRVKVCFPWHFPDGATTPWVRVANLMSGDKRGVYFVPEIDEIVFVDFEMGNPDQPFVRCSMYYGDVKPGDKLFQQNNNFKGFITKGGNHILIDDTSGKENIKIYNKECKNELVLSLDGGSHIHIKSEGKIKIDADEIEMNAKNINVNAREDFNLKSKNTSLESEYSTTVWAKNSTVGIGSDADDVTLYSPTEVRLMSDASIKLKSGGNATVEATASLKAKGLEVEIEGTTQAALKSSTQALVDGGPMTTVKGGFVFIN